MKSVKRSLIIVILVVAILITSVCAGLGVAMYSYLKNHYRKSQEIENYLSSYARNPSIIYSNEWGIYFSDRTLEFKDMEEYDIKVYSITKDYVYFRDEKIRDKVNVYRADHSFESVELILSYAGKTTYVSSTVIRYETEDGAKYIYSIEENKSSIDENYEQFWANYDDRNQYYSYDSKPDGFFSIFSNDNIYTITDKKTGAERKINQRYINTIEKDELTLCLADMGALHLKWVHFVDDNIYIICKYESIGTLFEYDFENEKM